MRSSGGHFVSNFRNRIPWAIAILALLIAASTGAYWASSRIRSLDTDLTAAGKQSTRFREQMRRMTAANRALEVKLQEVEGALSEATDSNSELKREKRDLRKCVSRSNPDGGPIVDLVPNHGPVGTRVEMIGSCFVGRFWHKNDPIRRFISLVGSIDEQGRVTQSNRKAVCELMAGGYGRVRVTRAGRMRGYFIVPEDGGCFQSRNQSALVAPGSYSLVIGCHACVVAEFRVTTERGERRRLQPCSSGDYRWFLEGPEGSGAMLVFGARVELARGAACRFDRSLTITISGPAGVNLPIRGNPATAQFVTAVGRQRTSAAWGWQNWCGIDGPYELNAVLGSERKTKSFAGSPRCNLKKYRSRLTPIESWMDGVASHTP